MTLAIATDEREMMLDAVGHELRLEALLRRAARGVAPGKRLAVRIMADDVRDQVRGLRRHAGGLSGRMPRNTVPLGHVTPADALDVARAIAEPLAGLHERLQERLVRSGAREAAIYVGICGRAKHEVLEGLRDLVVVGETKPAPKRKRRRPVTSPPKPESEAKQEHPMPETPTTDDRPSRTQLVAHEIETQRDEALDELGRWRRGLLVNNSAITEERDAALARAEKAERALAEAQAADGEVTSLLRELDAAKEEREELDAIRHNLHREYKEVLVRAQAAEAREKRMRSALENLRGELRCRLEGEGDRSLRSYWTWAECRFRAALARDGGE